jgi:hypothetical protein
MNTMNTMTNQLTYKFKLLFAVCIAMVSFQGCATMGAPFQFQGPDSVVVGKTTQSDVISQYGKPFRVGFENGRTKWTYGYYQYRLFGTSDTKDLAITFDNKRVVSDYTYSSSSPDEVNQALK